MGFRFGTNERWPYPNPTGLEGVMEGYCPPHFSDMREAMEALSERKFGPGGPFHPDTPSPWKNSGKIRSAAPVHNDEFKECVALQAQYIFDRFGKFPGTVPSMIAFDPSLTVVLPNPQNPSYPSEHAVVAGAASTVMAYLFPDKADDFRTRADQAAQAWVLAGLHYPSDVKAGLELGRAVGASYRRVGETRWLRPDWRRGYPAWGVPMDGN